MVRGQTAREAYHAARRYWHENDEVGVDISWPGGMRRAYRHNGIVRDSRFDPLRGVGSGFVELSMAAYRTASAVRRRDFREDAKPSIARSINLARACPAPVLP